MDVFPLRYPGAWIEGVSSEDAFEVTGLLSVLEHHLADAAVGLHLFEEVRARDRAPVAGMPGAYSRRLPFVHAHTVLLALDGVRKTLGKLASRPGSPSGVAPAQQAFLDAVPALADVRDSAQHLEDRARGSGKRGRIKLQPVNHPAIRAPAGALVLSNLLGNRLAYTSEAGHLAEVEICRDSVEAARAAIQGAIDAFAWTGPERISPA